MSRHKHIPIFVRSGTDDGVEECSICKSRRHYIVGSGRVTTTHFTRWWKNKKETDWLHKNIWEDKKKEMK